MEVSQENLDNEDVKECSTFPSGSSKNQFLFITSLKCISVEYCRFVLFLLFFLSVFSFTLFSIVVLIFHELLAMATMNICDVADIASHNPFESLSAGSFVGVRLVSKTPKGSFVASSRRSDLDSSEKRSGKKVKKVANSDEDEHAPLLLPSGTSSVGVGDKVWGYVKQTTTKGCFVWLSRSLVGRVTVSELSDRYVVHIRCSRQLICCTTGSYLILSPSSHLANLFMHGSLPWQVMAK